MIYLDNAATTQIHPEVLEAMMPYLKNEYGNAGTLYGLGRNAANAITHARQQVADFIGASPEQIIFTSGGSEANNLVFKGVKSYLEKIGKKHIIVSAVEHDSVLKAAYSLCKPHTHPCPMSEIKDEFYTQLLNVNTSGIIDLELLQGLLDDDKVGLVSVMYVNNETGAVNPIKKIGAMCKARGILFHTDCVQAAGCHAIDVEDFQCDFLSMSAHKIHGAKGTGALFVKNKDVLTSLISGGATQEFGLRGGTENVAGIVGFGKACEIIRNDFTTYRTAPQAFKRLFFWQLKEELTKYGLENIVHVNGACAISPGKTLNLRFENVDGETLLLMLDAKGIYVSAGSACRSHESKPSHVLLEMGLSADEARDSIRISFSAMNNSDEVKEAAVEFANCISILHVGVE